jgi:hypothetical protein
MAVAKRERELRLSAERQQCFAALDKLGGFIGQKVYREAQETVYLRVGLWLEEGKVTLTDVVTVCRGMAGDPEKLVGINWENEFLDRFTREVIAERNRRLADERRADERSKWPEELTVRQRAEVVKLLAGIGTRVGKNRRPQPPRFLNNSYSTTNCRVRVAGVASVRPTIMEN